MAKPPERTPAKPPASDAKPAGPKHDFSLDPLPVPDATESDGDTAWGLWQETLQANEESEDPPHTDFADTLVNHDTTHAPLQLEPLPEEKKPGKPEPGKKP